MARWSHLGLWSLLVVAALGFTSTARASPWVLDEDQVVISGRFDLQNARREFLDEGSSAQVFPLEGTYRAANFETSVRYGLLDRFELQLRVPVKVVSYTSDPVILLPSEEGGLDYYQDNTIDLSEHLVGVGDIRWSGIYQIIQGSFTTAVGLTMKTPTGYDRPAGTFGREPTSEQDFQENIATYVQPDNVEDDVTLGDGQVDLDAEVLLGWSLPSRTFLRLDAGYRLRLGGAGDQVLGDLKVGQLIGERLLLKVGSRLEYAVQDGEVIGISVAADDPTLPAEAYGGTTNLDPREVPLDYDRLTLNAGLILQVTESTEAQVSYNRVLWGRNTSLTQTLSMGLGVKFDASGEEG